MGKKRKQTGTVSEMLRAAINDTDETRYRICQNTGVDQATLSRFVNGKQKLSQDAIDTLADHFGLELREKRSRRS